MTNFTRIKLASAMLVSSAMLLACTANEPAPKSGNPEAAASAADLSRRIERLSSDEYEGRAPLMTQALQLKTRRSLKAMR